MWVASSKQRSKRAARMWSRMSPGVDTACRDPASISGNTCSPAGRAGPASRSHACDPIPTTQDNFASGSRNPTARSSPARSLKRSRTAAQLSAPGWMTITRKIAALVNGAATS